MKRAIVSTAISLTLSLCLLLGGYAASQFAYYVLIFFSCLSWIGVLCGLIKGEMATRIRKHAFLSGLGTGFQLYALIATDHPFLAASCFLVSFFIVSLAFGAKGDEPCAD